MRIMSQRAEEIISLYDREWTKAANFRTLYQDTADLVFPNQDQINRTNYPGREKTTVIYDTTAVMASEEMASGLSINLVPPGQRFFMLQASDRGLNQLESVKRSLNIITEVTHEHIFGSNFMSQLDQSLRNLTVFGMCNLYSEFTTFLNYRDYSVGHFLVMQNSKGRIDTALMKIPYTARQAFQLWQERCGEKVLEAYKDEKKRDMEFQFIWVLRPRDDRNPMFEDGLNMPIESIFVSVTDKEIIDEGGFEELPSAIARWTVASGEVYGRGRGTFGLPAIRSLQVMKRDLQECGNKHNNPPLEILEGHEDEVRVNPGALNFVRETGTIKAIDRNALGNFPITKETLESERDEVRNRIFYNDVFVVLANLKGDRRTTLEIRERKAEGLQRLGTPIGRVHTELFDSSITRTVLLLLRNGVFYRNGRSLLAPELEGQPFKVEYVGRLAMELRSQQARGWQQWILSGTEIEASFPNSGVLDNVDIDGGYRRLGETFGVNTEDIATPEEVEAKREARAQELAEQKAMEMAQLAAQGYGQTNKTPEEGSPAGELMEAVSG